jgi:hypothetical protein
MHQDEFIVLWYIKNSSDIDCERAAQLSGMKMPRVEDILQKLAREGYAKRKDVVFFVTTAKGDSELLKSQYRLWIPE